jgi:hypothetical protein
MWDWLSSAGARLMLDWLTMFGEWAIAGVIYYEIEAHRAATFMADVQSEEFYKARAQLYDVYARLSAGSLRQRADDFKSGLWKDADPKLRQICDHQWTSFIRLRFALRYSLFRRLLAKWMPQVVVSFWAMAHSYLEERDELRPGGSASRYGTLALRESLEELKKRGVKTLSIYSNDRKHEVKISISDVEKIMTD